MTTVHVLKTLTPYFNAVGRGDKPFEVRRDDREPRFKAGDLVVLGEWREDVVGGWTSARLVRRIGYLARGECIPEGYCVFALEAASDDDLRTALVVCGEIVVSR